MSTIRGRVLTMLAVGCLAAAARPAAQASVSLSELTVPTQRLPNGCRLEPVVPDAGGGSRFVMYPGIRQNPWASTGRQHAASIREIVDGPARPKSGLSGPAEHQKMAEDVAESYRARYVGPNAERIDVYAVRFNDPALTLTASMNRLIIDPPQPPRIVLGSAAVLVLRSSGNPAQKSPFDHQPEGEVRSPERGSECLRAITEHIGGLKLRPAS